MTTTAIANRCHDEELVTVDRLYRIQCLERQLNAGLPRCEVQLACEAIKFHQIRLAGHDLESALHLMGVA
jgi:hypothetical protein